MTPYSIAFTVFRLTAVGLLLFLLYTWVVYLASPAPDLGSGAKMLQANFPNLPNLRELQHQSMVQTSQVLLGSAAFLYFFAPLLARVVALGHQD